MKALTFHGPKQIVYESVPDPAILDPTDVIIKVRQTAICGSDLHVYHGREMGLDCGSVMGHEFSGEVVATGSKVRGFKSGDRVVSPFTTNCGFCHSCSIGLTCRCENGDLYGWVEQGKGLQGAQAEYVRAPHADATLVKLSPELDFELGLFLGDIMATGFYIADMAHVNPKGVYAVVGCGPVGLMAIVGAREMGAEMIFAIDCVPERLELAKSFGAITINYNETNACEYILSLIKGQGADAVMEAVGNPSAGRLAYDLVRPGGIISVAGVHTEPYFSFSPTEAYNKNLTYKVGRCPARKYMDKLLPVVKSDSYNLKSIISHRMPLKDGVNGYDIFTRKADGCTKVMLTP